MEFPEPIDMAAKLYRLKDRLDELDAEDQQFVDAMVGRLEEGGSPFLNQVLRIVDLRVPGEAPLVDPILREGAVTALRKDLDRVIWRYMPLEQVFFLLSTRTLHFSPLSCMKDTSEGQLPKRAFERTKVSLPAHFSQPGAVVDRDTITNHLVASRQRDACITSWYMDDADNIAMWDEYAPRYGAAIRTTVGRLHSALGGCCDTNIHLDRVTYYGPLEEERYADDAYLGSLFIKHAEGFRHEKEFRAVAYRTNNGHGVNVPIGLNVLIESLVLSPDLPDWAAPYITQLIAALGFAGQIERSAERSTRTANLDAKGLIEGLQGALAISSGWYEGSCSAKVRDEIETVVRKIEEPDNSQGDIEEPPGTMSTLRLTGEN